MGAYNEGIGSLIRGLGDLGMTALVKAPMARQQAEETAALRNAQTYAANMAGNKHGSEAAGNQFTLEQRKGIDDYIAANPDLSPYERTLALSYKWTGDTNIERLANARGQFQTQDIRDLAVKNVGNPDLMNRLNALGVPGATYQPYKAIGNTGHSVNEATGVQTQASPALAGLHSGETNSRIRVNNAQAGNASALAERTKAEAELIRTNSAPAQNQGSTPDAVQLRLNADVEAARKNARTPQYDGKGAVPEVSPNPTSTKVSEPPSTWQTIIDMVGQFLSDDQAKSSSASEEALRIKQYAERIREAYKAKKITREEAKRQLQTIGYD